MRNPALGLLVLLFVGCTQPQPDRPGSANTAPPTAAERFYTARCAACHGPHGAGDGPMAGSLRPRPRDLGNRTWQAFATDEHIAKAITEGGAAVGRSLMMPASPDVLDTPGLTDGLVRLIRSFERGK